MKTLKEVKAAIKAVGMAVRKTPDGEFRVNFPNGKEATAYYTDDAQDAIGTAKFLRQWAEEHPSAGFSIHESIPAGELS